MSSLVSLIITGLKIEGERRSDRTKQTVACSKASSYFVVFITDFDHFARTANVLRRHIP